MNKNGRAQPSNKTGKSEVKPDWKMDVSVFEKNGCLINFN